MSGTMIIEVRQGETLPKGTRFVQILQTWDKPIGVGTNTERVYVVLVEKRC